MIGRRALIALGLPVMTRDYDCWIPADDAGALNEALRPLDMVSFEDVWQRRMYLPIAEDVAIAVPSIDDLILTKKFAARPRDADDVRWLEKLRASRP
jgi:hypothetical protein